ncbi:MAG: hypothetical protein JRF05_00100, partial [Deltaproteobacteria bacterium]|nr:hypothetical protein [Deltaproteobacteria bacterium]
ETSLLLYFSQKFQTVAGAGDQAIITLAILEDFHIEITHGVFWMMMAVIAILGAALVYRDYYQTKTESRYHNRLLSQLKADEISVDEILALEYVPREIISYLRQTGILSVQQKNTIIQGSSKIFYG